MLWQNSNKAAVELPVGNHTVVGQVRDRWGAVAESVFTVLVVASTAPMSDKLEKLQVRRHHVP